MMKFSRTHIDALMLALVLTAALTLDSCRDELCYNHFSGLSLSLDWEQEWERDYGMNHASTWDADLHGISYDSLRPGTPEWVNLVRIMPDGSQIETFLNSNGDDVMIDPTEGQSLLLYNGDTEYIILSDIATPTQARASATGRSRASIASVSEAHPNARTTNPPDLLYGAYVSGLPSVGTHETLPLDITMQPLVYTYVVRYEFDYGFEYVALARGALGGMAESVYLLTGHTSEESTIILYDCELKDFGCVAHVRSFGIPGFPDEYYGRTDTQPSPRNYTLNLEVRLKNGKFVEFNTDITHLIAKQPRGGVITVSGLRIEDEAGYSDAGFNVEIDGWGDRVDIDLPIQVVN